MEAASAMPHTAHAADARTATAALKAIIRDLGAKDAAADAEKPADAPGAGEAALGAVIERLDERAFGFMLRLLALPCSLPFVYVLPQIVALPMLALAAQMAAGRDSPWLPAKLAARRFQTRHFLTVIERSERYVGWIEAIARPRALFVTGRTGARIAGALLLIPCASILVPLPATNTAPGIGVAIAALGLIERDGAIVILGIALGVAWVAFLGIFGLEAASLLKAWLAARL